MPCPRCNVDLPDDSKVCPACGASLDTAAADARELMPATQVAGPPDGEWQRAVEAPGSGWPQQVPVSARRLDPRRWSIADAVIGLASLLLAISLFLDWFTFDVPLVGLASRSGTWTSEYLYAAFALSVEALVYVVARAVWSELRFPGRFADHVILVGLTTASLAVTLIGIVTKPAYTLLGVPIPLAGRMAPMSQCRQRRCQWWPASANWHCTSAEHARRRWPSRRPHPLTSGPGCRHRGTARGVVPRAGSPTSSAQPAGHRSRRSCSGTPTVESGVGERREADVTATRSPSNAAIAQRRSSRGPRRPLQLLPRRVRVRSHGRTAVT